MAVVTGASTANPHHGQPGVHLGPFTRLNSRPWPEDTWSPGSAKTASGWSWSPREICRTMEGPNELVR